MEVGAASKSVGHYQDINAAAKEGAALSLAEIRGVSMEVGAASKSAVQNFPSTLNSDDIKAAAKEAAALSVDEILARHDCAKLWKAVRPFLHRSSVPMEVVAASNEKEDEEPERLHQYVGEEVSKCRGMDTNRNTL
jgi:hypothetical protein